MASEVEVTIAEVLAVRHEDGSFAIMNAQTREVWPITKQGMLTLAGQLDKWFKEISDGE